MPTLSRTSVEDLDPATAALLLDLTGISNAAFRRLVREDPRQTVQAALGDAWPPARETLAELRVSTARAVDLAPELAAYAGITVRTVRQRVASASGNSKLKNVIPELVARTLPSLEEVSLGEVPVKLIREADSFVRWLSARTSLSLRATRSRLRDSHGAKHLGNLFADVWPRDLGDEVELRGMLAGLFAPQAAEVEAFLLWIGWFVEIKPTQVLTRLGRAAEGESVGDVFPDLVEVEDIDAGGPEAREVPVAAASAPTLVAGRWRLIRPLGEGGFGAAHEAEDTRLAGAPPIVIKQARTDAEAVRLQAEYRIAQQLTHENICAYNHIDHDPGFGWFAVLRHGGESLDRILSRTGPWAARDALDLCAAVAAGLDHAHAQTILHLDVKPANILVESGRRRVVRIGDWGVSVAGRDTRRGGRATVVASQGIGFSPPYAAPEQIFGEPRKSSDQYALARVFCAIVAGREPHSAADLPLPQPGISRAANDALAMARHHDGNERFHSCRAFVSALRAAL